MLEGAQAVGSVPLEGEAELIERAITGHEIAFTRLYDTHYDRVYRYILRLVRSVEDAEDLTQKVFLQAWRGLSRYRRTQSPFVAWLIAIAHNLTMSFFRSRKVNRSLEGDLPEAVEPPAPVAAIADLGEQELVRDAILRLNPEQQQVVTMRFFEGFECGEIAAAIGKSEGNVRVIQHRALQKLRGVLEERESHGKG